MPSSRARPSSSTVTQAEYELLAELRYSLRRFSTFSENAAKAIGLTPTQHQALLVIKGFPSGAHVSVGDLAERLFIRHHSAVGLVDRLIALGHVRRTTDAGDRRRVNLSLTRRGEAVLAQLSAAHRDELMHIGRDIEALLARLRHGAEKRLLSARKKPRGSRGPGLRT
jgi:DNA-binding MarR family transcriptional regulator